MNLGMVVESYVTFKNKIECNFLKSKIKDGRHYSVLFEIAVMVMLPSSSLSAFGF